MPDKTILLATDLQQSVLIAHDVNQSHPIAHTPYGHRPQGSSLLSQIGFNGQMPDPVTGHYHLGNGYRQYSPVLMRFNSPDSWSPFGAGWLNTYMYCAGEPINRQDSSGHRFSLIVPNPFLTRIANHLNKRTQVHRHRPGLSPFTVKALKKTKNHQPTSQIEREAADAGMGTETYFIRKMPEMQPLKLKYIPSASEVESLKGREIKKLMASTRNTIKELEIRLAVQNDLRGSLVPELGIIADHHLKETRFEHAVHSQLLGELETLASARSHSSQNNRDIRTRS